MSIEVVEGAFDPWQRLAAYQGARDLCDGRAGAAAVFVGTMRDFNDAAAVTAMTLEHYPGMTERCLESIEAQARRRWSLHDVLVLHRVGRILPGEAIVLVAAWASHRASAFAACRFLIEELKTRAPFWKHEQSSRGERWVAANTHAEDEQGTAGGSAVPESKETCV
jgi:molybdopterin synthase catalytic subunit